jgi:hypothetical protein
MTTMTTEAVFTNVDHGRMTAGLISLVFCHDHSLCAVVAGNNAVCANKATSKTTDVSSIANTVRLKTTAWLLTTLRVISVRRKVHGATVAKGNHSRSTTARIAMAVGTVLTTTLDKWW